jgi:hypothetical protein
MHTASSTISASAVIRQRFKLIYMQGGFMKRICYLFQWVVILFVGFAFIAAAAEQTKDRRYTLPDHGVLQMKVPVSWKEEVQQPPDDRLPPRIFFRPARGDLFVILITPIWKVKKDAPLLTDSDLKKMVQRVADDNEQNAVEKTLKIIELQGASGRGYYFSATDKAPAPDDYKFITYGALLVGELTVAIFIATNDDKKDVESAALEMIKTAIQVTEKGN